VVNNSISQIGKGQMHERQTLNMHNKLNCNFFSYKKYPSLNMLHSHAQHESFSQVFLNVSTYVQTIIMLGSEHILMK